MSENMVALDDICQHLAVNSVTVYTWISTRKMPAHLVDGTWMFDVQQVDEWKQDGGITEADAVPDKAD